MTAEAIPHRHSLAGNLPCIAFGADTAGVLALRHAARDQPQHQSRVTTEPRLCFFGGAGFRGRQKARNRPGICMLAQLIRRSCYSS